MLINRNEQKLKGCHSWLTFKSCETHFFHFKFPTMRSFKGQIPMPAIPNYMGSNSRIASCLHQKTDVNLDLKGKLHRPSCCVMMQYIRAGNQAPGTAARTRGTPLSHKLSAYVQALLISLYMT